MSGLDITETSLDGEWISLAVEGEIDLATVDELRAEIDRIAKTRSHLLVDLRATSFMDSTGLKALITANRAFGEEHRSFALAVKGGPIWRLIDLSGVASTIRIVEDPSELVGAPNSV